MKYIERVEWVYNDSDLMSHYSWDLFNKLYWVV